MSKNKTYRKFAVTTMAAAAAVASVAPVVASADTTSFPDVKKGTDGYGAVGVHYEPIMNLAGLGIISGFPEQGNKFKPWDNVVRGQVAKMIVKAQGWETPSNIDEVLEVYKDVDANNDYAKEIAAATAGGAFQGNQETGLFKEYDDISREQMATVLVRAFDLDKIEVDEEVKVNLDHVSDTHKDAVQTLANLGITTELSNFRAYDKISRAAFSTFLDRTMKVDKAHELTVKNIDVVNENTLSVTLSDDETYAVTLDKALEPNVATEVTFTIGDKEYTETVTWVVEDAEVVSVSAINASEVLVTFNKPIDAATAKDWKNYEIKVNNVHVDVADNIGTKDAITVSKDKKSAIIRLASTFQNGDKYVVQTNDAIKSEDGQALTKFVSDEATFAESAAPKLVKVTPGVDQLELEFDRPAKHIASTLVKVDGYDVDGTATSPTPLTATSNAAGSYTYTVDVTDADAQAEAFDQGDHEVIVYDVEDTASAYPARASVLNGSYTISDEVTVPEVKEVVEVNANKFFLRTNVPVDLSTAKLTVEKGNHEFALVDGNFVGDTDIDGSGKTSAVDAVAGTYLSPADHGVWVVVSDAATTDENPLYKGSETKADLKVTLENYKDAATQGLLGKKSVTNVTLNKNNSKPEVESTKVSGTKLVVDFGGALESATSTAFNAADVIVRNKDGVIITGVTSAAIDSGDGETVEIDLGANHKTADEPYSVEFKAGKLKYKEVKNVISGYLVNTLGNDKLKTQVYSSSTNFKYKELALTVGGNVTLGTTNKGQDTVTINYATDMDDSARDVANYQLDGKALPAGSTVDFVDNKEKVRIVLPQGSLKASTSYKLTVSTNVKTKEGSIIVGSLQTKAPAETVINLTDNIAPTLTEAKYLRGDEDVKPSTSTNQIEVTFSEAVEIGGSKSSTDAEVIDDLKVEVSNTAIDVNEIDVDPTNNKRMIITLDQDVNISQAATITVVPEADQKHPTDKTTYIVDKAGNKAEAGSTVDTAGSKYDASIGKAQAIAAADVELGKLTFEGVNSITDNADLATAKSQHAAAKSAVDAATAKGAVSGDFDTTDYPKLAAQKTEIDRYEAVAAADADIAADAAALTVDLNPAQLTLETTGANGSTITWSSDNTGVVTDAGVYAGTGSAVLTAKVNKTNGSEVEVKFNVTADGSEITNVEKQ